MAIRRTLVGAKECAMSTSLLVCDTQFFLCYCHHPWFMLAFLKVVSWDATIFGNPNPPIFFVYSFCLFQYNLKTDMRWLSNMEEFRLPNSHSISIHIQKMYIQNRGQSIKKIDPLFLSLSYTCEFLPFIRYDVFLGVNWPLMASRSAVI